jgi:hypothetical protein
MTFISQEETNQNEWSNPKNWSFFSYSSRFDTGVAPVVSRSSRAAPDFFCLAAAPEDGVSGATPATAGGTPTFPETKLPPSKSIRGNPALSGRARPLFSGRTGAG